MTYTVITSIFKPIELKSLLDYLKNLSSPLSFEVSQFVNLSEEDISSYTIPSNAKKMRDRYITGDYSKDSIYTEINTVITAMEIIVSCAQINKAIYALQNRYKKNEEEMQTKYHIYNDDVMILIKKNWSLDKNEDVINLKNAIIKARDKINYFSHKYTVKGFQEDFISEVRPKIYSLCDKFRLEPRTKTDKAKEGFGNFINYLICFVIFCLLFYLVVKCATGK